MVLTVIVILVASLLAYANGANDNAKGVATLIGSRALALKPAIIYAGIMTFAGSIVAIFLAGELVARFSGKGIVDPAIISNIAFPISVALGAGLTVLLATLIGMPISTTHAMVGSIIGIGLAASGLNWVAVWLKFFYPLLLAPLLAIGLATLVYLVFRTCRRALGVTHQTCLCIEKTEEPVHVATDGSVVLKATGVRLTHDQVEHCRERYDGQILGVNAQSSLNVSHFLSAGVLSFARGLNDTPKIAAIIVVAGALGSPVSITVVAVAMAAGGLLAVRKVAKTMSYRITEMNDGQALSANLTTAFLVIFASKWGLPVSTTHVSCGSLFGIGLVNRRAHWKTIGKILLAWITTLPVAALIAFLVWHGLEFLM